MTIRNAIFDALTELVPHGTVKTASFDGVAIDYPLTPNHPHNDSHKCRVRAIFNVTALALSGATVELVLKVDDDAFGSPTVVAKQAITAPGQYELLVSLDTVKKLESGATKLKGGVAITGGTSPSITFGAFATK
jgi:hypothetical protein